MTTIARRPGEAWPDAPQGEDPYKTLWRQSQQDRWDRVGAKLFASALTPTPDPNQPLIDAVTELTKAIRGDE